MESRLVFLESRLLIYAGYGTEVSLSGSKDCVHSVGCDCHYSSADADAEVWRYEQVRRDAVEEMEAAYYDLFMAQKLTDVVNRSKTLLQQFVEISESLYEVGKGSQQDVLKAQVEVSRLLDRLAVLERDRETALARINTLLYRSPDTPVVAPAYITRPKLAYTLDQLYQKATPELTLFLLDRVKRPMKLAVIPEESEGPAFERPVKHLSTISGDRGVLRIYTDKVVYQSSRVGESRYWRLEDIERFSQPDRFRFQIVSYVPEAGGPTEVYNFQLIRDLPEGVHDYLWVRLNPLSYYPAVQDDRSKNRQSMINR